MVKNCNWDPLEGPLKSFGVIILLNFTWAKFTDWYYPVPRRGGIIKEGVRTIWIYFKKGGHNKAQMVVFKQFYTGNWTKLEQNDKRELMNEFINQGPLYISIDNLV